MSHDHDRLAGQDQADAGPQNPSRRVALECMVWAGAGVLWTVAGGVPRSRLISPAEAATAAPGSNLSFVQISDSHIGFKNPPNANTPGTLTDAIGLVKEQKGNAAFMIHTGDVSHLSRPDQFDTADQINRGAGLPPCSGACLCLDLSRPRAG